MKSVTKTISSDGHPEAFEQNFHLNGALVNPFQGLTHDQMVSKIHDFVNITHIEAVWRDYIWKGAFLAQDPKAFDQKRPDHRTLDEDEMDEIEIEHRNKWDQPFILYAVVACCSLGAAVQGWDEVRSYTKQM